MKFHSVPKDGSLWRLDGYGGLYLHPGMTSQLSFNAAISPIAQSEGKSVPSRFGSKEFGVIHQTPLKATIAGFGIGELAALPVGVIFANQQPQRLPKTLYRQETFTLDFDNQQLCKLEDGILGERYLVPIDDYRFGKAWKEVKESRYICLPIKEHHSNKPKRIEHEYAIMVPVMEMARACYGRSSKLLQTLFSYELHDLLEWIRATGSVNRDRIYTMELPAPFAPKDAWVLAWLALDKHAENCAKQLMLSVAQTVASKRIGHSVYPEAEFPFMGTAKIKVLGKWVGVDNSPKQRFLVYRIHEIEYPMPYSDVVIQIDPSGEVVEDASVGGTLMHRNQRVSSLGVDSEIRNDLEPNAKAAQVTLLTVYSQPFASLRGKTPQKDLGGASSDSTIVSKLVVSATPNPNADLSTGEGSNSSDARKASIAESDQPQEPAHWPDKIPPDLETVVAAVKILEVHGISATFLQVGSENKSSNNLGVAVSWFPKSQKWSRIGSRLRTALVIHLQFKGRNYYLLEKEHVNDPNSHQKRPVFGYIPLMHKPDYALVEHCELAEILKIWAENLGKWPRGGLSGGWSIERLRHQYNSDDELAQRIAQGCGLGIDTQSKASLGEKVVQDSP